MTRHIAGSIELESWREQARALLRSGAAPGDVEWVDPADPQGSLYGARGDAAIACTGSGDHGPSLMIPREFMSLARFVLAHRDRSKWPLLYRIAWRMTRGEERGLLTNALDDDVFAARSMAKAVKRDAHKMKAFVRFRRVSNEQQLEHFVAFHRPDHPIVRIVAPFFAQRFSVMRWAILTPYGSAAWDLRELSFGPPASADQSPASDTLEDFWKTYYSSVFNPARVNPSAMTREMPKRYWSTLPEAALIDELLANAPKRTEAMAARTIGAPAGGAAPYIPATNGASPAVSLRVLAEAAPLCRGCDLHERATGVVFGHGPADARLMLVGEQPGDQEDRAGLPFVGPAGEVLNSALLEAGIKRERCYLTNAVKHFKWIPEPRGKRRIHAKPVASEVRACKPWLERELSVVKPVVLVLLGATAAQSLFGAGFRVTQRRGEVMRDTAFAPAVIATIHPSAVLRTPDPSARAKLYASFVDDLRAAARLVAISE